MLRNGTRGEVTNSEFLMKQYVRYIEKMEEAMH